MALEDAQILAQKGKETVLSPHQMILVILMKDLKTLKIMTILNINQLNYFCKQSINPDTHRMTEHFRNMFGIVLPKNISF
jgi:hypothetical protein